MIRKRWKKIGPTEVLEVKVCSWWGGLRGSAASLGWRRPAIHWESEKGHVCAAVPYLLTILLNLVDRVAFLGLHKRGKCRKCRKSIAGRDRENKVRRIPGAEPWAESLFSWCVANHRCGIWKLFNIE